MTRLVQLILVSLQTGDVGFETLRSFREFPVRVGASRSAALQRRQVRTRGNGLPSKVGETTELDSIPLTVAASGTYPPQGEGTVGFNRKNRSFSRW